jgi:hypothetical protein
MPICADAKAVAFQGMMTIPQEVTDKNLKSSKGGSL